MLLNVAGIAFLCARSIEIREWGFVVVNSTTLAFWGLAAGVKAWGPARAPPAALAAAEPAE